jgi:hypothetical protein
MESELYLLRKQLQDLMAENDALKQALANARKIAVEQRNNDENILAKYAANKHY